MYIKTPKIFCNVSLLEIWLKILSKNNEKGSKANCTNSQGKKTSFLARLAHFVSIYLYFNGSNSRKALSWVNTVLTYFIFQVASSKKSRFHWKKQPLRKNVIVEGELVGIDIDDGGHLEDSPRLVFIDEGVHLWGMWESHST